MANLLDNHKANLEVSNPKIINFNQMAKPKMYITTGRQELKTWVETFRGSISVEWVVHQECTMEINSTSKNMETSTTMKMANNWMRTGIQFDLQRK